MSTIRNFFLKPWLYILIVLVGTALKFYHLDSKLFWMDEVSSVLYTSGANESNIQQIIPVNQIKTFDYYNSFLHAKSKPQSFKNELTGVLSGTHLTPAHYIFLSFWYRLVGDENLDYRLFSVFIFIISLPFIFLLAKNLFDTNLAGWIAISLYAVSPFIQFEAQEARYYMLWVFFFVLTNYLFLHAIKQKKTVWWIAYSIAAILSLYISITSGAFIVGHLVYILMFQKKLRLQFLVCLLFIGLAYLPWMYFLFTRSQDIESGLSWHKFLASSLFPYDLLFYQLIGFVRQFVYLFDYDLYHLLFTGTITNQMYPVLIIDLAVLAVIIYSIYYLLAKSSKWIRWFLILIILPLVCLFLVSDIIRHTGSSMLWRYQMVNMAGISFIVTNLLKDKIQQGKLLFVGLYMGLIFLGLASILEITSNLCWNTSPNCEPNMEEAQLISQAGHPLIITDFNGAGISNFLAVLNKSKAKTADIIYGKGILTNLKLNIAGKGYSDIYVLEASDSLTQQVKLQFGESMLPLRKDMNMFTPQIWHIKL